MASVQLFHITLSFGDKTILDDVTLSLASGDRCALAGANGSGKTTLMKVIAGLQEFDAGEIVKQRGTIISYLPQSGILYSETSLFDEVDKAYHRHHAIEERKHTIESKLDDATSTEDELHTLVEEQHRLQELLLSSGYYERHHKKEEVLSGLGFNRSDFSRPCSSFSGGRQMRIALAKILLEQPHILLLDEPTNYLDLEARSWLEEFLLTYRGGLLVVSHDRFFLDTVVEKVYRLFLGDVKKYVGNYSSYEKKYEEETASHWKKYEEQQREIERSEEFIRRFRYNSSKAQLVQSRIKALEKMERIQPPETTKTVHFTFPAAPHCGRRVISVSNLSKSYGQRNVLNDMYLTIERGERIVVTGKNGIGKSTLLRIVAGEDTDYRGDIRYGTNVSVGYFAQDHEFFLDPEKTILEEIETHSPTQVISTLRDLLGAFLFSDDAVLKKVGVLSGGEKSRVSLLKLLLQPVNCLILDEPTNHLDIRSKDVLLHALQQFTGTILFVSHDRYFIEHIATKIVELRPGSYKVYPGDYHYYRRIKEKEEGDREWPTIDGNSQNIDPSEGKERHQQEKQKRNRIKSMEEKEHRILQQIETLEQQLDELSQHLEKPEVYSLPEKAYKVQDSIEKNRALQGQLLQEWEEIEAILSKHRSEY